jgi:carboxymethylenebutenolidase
MPWNQYETTAEGGMVAGVTTIPGGSGSPIHAYVARPDGAGPYPGVLLIHHVPGWDEFYREFSRRFAEHGFMAICPNLFESYGSGTPDEVAARARADGYPSDAQIVADADAAIKWLKSQPQSNGKVGVIGSCSGGRHSVLVASSIPSSVDAAVNLWGGNVVQPADRLSAKQPVAPIDLVPQMTAPLLGLFGNDDMNPSPDNVNQLEAVLKEHNKTYQFHRYDGAGHGFFYYQGMSYRPQAAMDGWGKVEAWFQQYLA